MIKIYELKALQNNYIVSLNFKGVKVRCEFKDGNIAKQIHARLFTNDRFKQMAIEQSELNGKMWQLVKSIPEPDDNKPKQSTDKPAAKPQGADSDGQDAKTPEEGQDLPADGQAGNTKEFANVAEAIMYIATTYNEQVTNASQARKLLADKGIKAVIHNG